MKIYFDTNVVRYLSEACTERELPQALQARVVLSPVSALETMSQLCDDSATQAFAALKAMVNWLPERVNVLDIPPIFVQMNVAGVADDGQGTFERLTNALNQCLRSRSAEHLRDASRELRLYLQRSKLRDAERQRDAVLAMREGLRRAKRKLLSDAELRDGFLESIAQQAKVHRNHPGVAPFVDRISAYCEYETKRLSRAIENVHFNLLSKKRQNDLFDSKQLLYLSVPDLCFLTSDRGYSHLAGEQRGRIHIAKPEELTHFESASEIIRQAIQ